MPASAPRWLSLWARGELAIEEISAAPLRLTSGRIVACDPLVFLKNARPFTRPVPRGEHRVVLGRAEGEVVLACVRLAARPVASWETALCPGEEDLEEVPGYSVESGAACFADAEAAARRAAHEDALLEEIGAELEAEGVDRTDALGFHLALQDRLEQRGEDLFAKIQPGVEREGWASVTIDSEGGNLVVWKAAAGEAPYASYWGLDRSGRPVCLVTDLGLIADDDELEEAEDEDEEAEGEGEGEELEGEDSGPAKAPVALSPLFVQVRELLGRWVRDGKVELEPEVDLEILAEALLERLGRLEGRRRIGARIAEWLVDRPEVADLYASDDELEADLRRR